MNWEMKLCSPEGDRSSQKILLAERQRWYMDNKDGERTRWNETAATSPLLDFLILKEAGGTKPR